MPTSSASRTSLLVMRPLLAMTCKPDRALLRISISSMRIAVDLEIVTRPSPRPSSKALKAPSNTTPRNTSRSALSAVTKAAPPANSKTVLRACPIKRVPARNRKSLTRRTPDGKTTGMSFSAASSMMACKMLVWSWTELGCRAGTMSCATCWKASRNDFLSCDGPALATVAAAPSPRVAAIMERRLTGMNGS